MAFYGAGLINLAIQDVKKRIETGNGDPATLVDILALLVNLLENDGKLAA